MDPRDDSDDLPRDDSDDNDPLVRELRDELVRLEAQLDQILAAEREHGEEVARLQLKMVELQDLTDATRTRYRQRARLLLLIGLVYGTAVGMALSWFLRLW